LRDWSDDSVHSISEGLSVENAVCGWHAAIDAVLANEDDFETYLGSHHRPARIGIVLARGVFTAGIEWVSLGLASGASVHVKVPHGLLSGMGQWLTAFKDAGFPLTFGEDRNIPPVDLLWVFGDDGSIDTIKQSTEYAVVEAYGHRFSLAIATDSVEDAKQIAHDIAMYDTRGCMAPVAVLCTGDADLFAERLFTALREIEQHTPLGSTDPFLGPEIRRRVGLALQRPNQVWLERSQSANMDTYFIWGVLRQQEAQFTPSALSRLPSVYHTPNPSSIDKILGRWADKISTVAISKTLDAAQWIPESILKLQPRICTLGEMQRPPFPRLHDGRSMWSQK